MAKLQEKQVGRADRRPAQQMGAGALCLPAPTPLGMDDLSSRLQHVPSVLPGLAFCFPEHKNGGERREEPGDPKTPVSIQFIRWVTASSACLRSTVEPGTLGQKALIPGMVLLQLFPHWGPQAVTPP